MANNTEKNLIGLALMQRAEHPGFVPFRITGAVTGALIHVLFERPEAALRKLVDKPTKQTR